MTDQKKLLGLLGAGGICLLGLALLDGAIKGLEHLSNIQPVWKTCGILGGVLLAAYVILGVFDRESYLRQGVRLGWDRLFARWPKRAKAVAEATDSAEAAGADAKPEEWQPPSVEETAEETVEDEARTDGFPRPVGATSQRTESNGSGAEDEEEEPEEATTSSGSVSRLPK